MEPPSKRRRLSPRNEPVRQLSRTDTAIDQTGLEPAVAKVLDEPRLTAHSTSISVSNLGDTQRQPMEIRGAHIRRSLEHDLSPRAPQITVTASVVDIAILDGVDKTSFLQVAAQSSELHVPISGIGTLTVPGVTPSGAPSPTSGTAHSGSSDPASTGLIAPSSASGNATSTSDKIVTVTATSKLQVTLRNGTVTLTSISRHRTVFTAEGFTATIDDSLSSTFPTGSRFGDVNTSYQHAPTIAQNSNGAPSSVTASSSSATSTGAGSTPAIVLTPQQQQMVGGVVGGVAGIALVLLGILFFLRWYRQRLKLSGRLTEQSSGHRQLPSGDDHVYIAPAVMAQSLPSSILPVASLKRSMQKLRPHSSQTLRSSTTGHSSLPAPENEKTFQRLSGRKIPSVLLTGGDGYGGQGPVSPLSRHSFSRSREVSQTSFFRDSNYSNNQFPPASDTDSIYGSPPRVHASPFADPPAEGLGIMSPPKGTPSISTVDFAALNASRSRLAVQTGGLNSINSTRQSDGSVMIRPSPARTPTTTSPTSSSLRLPMHTPPLLSGDVPEMPPLQPWRHNTGPRKYSDDALSIKKSVGQRSVSGISARSSSTVGGRFKEEI